MRKILISAGKHKISSNVAATRRKNFRSESAVTSKALKRTFGCKCSSSTKHPSRVSLVHSSMGHGPLLGSLDLTHSSMVFFALIDLAVQWGGFAVSYALQTEKFFDLLGATTFFSVAIGSLCYGGFYFARQVVATVMVMAWSGRLGSFLFMRVLKTGKDSRFDELKDKPLKFLALWTGQALWVWVTLFPVMVLNTSARDFGFRWSDVVGPLIWAVGFACEVTADTQKTNWKKDPANKGRFINVGLWKYARYPNYFGEISLWWGMWIFCLPALHAGYYATIISPLFVMVVILGGSGVPIQEKQARQRWGKEAAYHQYKRSTNLLVPVPWFHRSLSAEEADRLAALHAEKSHSSTEVP